MKSIIIIPTYNERNNIQDMIPTLRKEAQGLDLDILIVDSASPDGTAEEVREIQKKDSRVFLLEQSAKLGLAKAYLDGMRWVLSRPYAYYGIITMDADFSHHPRYIPRMIQALEGKDLVIGSRYVRGGGLQNWPLYRHCLSRFANWYARTLTGLPFSDLTSGFQCFRGSFLKQILKNPIHVEGYAFLVELKFLSVLNKARTVETPITFTDRTRGDSKISKKVIFESMVFVLGLALQRGRVKRILAEQRKEA